MAIARTFPWANYRSFVDVGTAQGNLAVQIALADRHLQGVAFDLPEGAPVFEESAANAVVTDRLRYLPGDFFKHDISKADE